MRNHPINTAKLDVLPVPQGTTLRLTHVTDPKKLAAAAKEGYPPPKYATLATLYAEGMIVAEASAFCSDRDVPNRKLGRIIATNRCIKEYLKTKHE